MERLSDYDYHLPEELIAQKPLEDRSSSRLLHLDLRTGGVKDGRFTDVVETLRPGDLLVWNSTRVTALRLFGQKPTGGSVEAMLVHQTGPDRFAAMLKPAKRLKPGARIHFEGGLEAEVAQHLEEPLKEIRFLASSDLPEKLAAFGRVPLPPYITHALDDPERYQTVYSKVGGSAAAPTAGLHFTPELIEKLTAKGISIAEVSLDVSLDTFRPVMVDDLEAHVMHGEVCRLPESTADLVNACRGRVIAVGTTSARTLESFAIEKGKVEPGEHRTSIFIRPGYEWKIVQGMFTNFHMPRTTMLMMISALAGKPNILKAYEHAIQQRYRFLSFGDSMLIL